jgi:hypothetical protein
MGFVACPAYVTVIPAKCGSGRIDATKLEMGSRIDAIPTSIIWMSHSVIPDRWGLCSVTGQPRRRPTQIWAQDMFISRVPQGMRYAVPKSSIRCMLRSG